MQWNMVNVSIGSLEMDRPYFIACDYYQKRITICIIDYKKLDSKNIEIYMSTPLSKSHIAFDARLCAIIFYFLYLKEIVF